MYFLYVVGDDSFELELISAPKTSPVFRDVCLAGNSTVLRTTLVHEFPNADTFGTVS